MLRREVVGSKEVTANNHFPPAERLTRKLNEKLAFEYSVFTQVFLVVLFLSMNQSINMNFT